MAAGAERTGRRAAPTGPLLLWIVLAATIPGLVAPPSLAGQVPADRPGEAARPTAVLADVSGQVVEATTSRSVATAEVVLTAVSAAGDRDDAGLTRSGTTDARGRYHLADVPPGTYRLTVSRLGYRTATLWLEVPSESVVRRSVGLDLEPIRLEVVGIEVPGLLHPWSRPGRERSPSTSPRTSVFGADGGRPTLDARALTAAEVRRLSTIGEPDVLRSLQRLPGVSSRGDFSADLWTRGAPWGMTRILLDGLPLYHPLHIGGTTSGFTTEGLDAVVLMPGVRPAHVAEGAAGTVNIVSRPARSGGDLLIGFSSLALRTHWEDRMVRDRVGLSVTARRSWWDVVDPPPIFTGDASSRSIDYYFIDLMGRFDARLPGDVMLEAGGLREEDHIDGDVGDLVGDSRGRWGNRVGWVSLARAWEDVALRAMVGRSTHSSWTRPLPWSSFFSDDGIPSLDVMTLDLGRTLLRIEARGGQEGGLTWSGGLDRARETLSQAGLDATDRQAPGVYTLMGDVPAARSGPAETEWTRLWGQASAELGPASISAGLVREDAAHDERPRLLPNLRLRLRPVPWLALEAAGGRSTQSAYPMARAGRSFGPALGVGHVWMLAGEDVPPLVADARTLGAEVTLAHGFGFGTTLYRRHVSGVSLDGVGVPRDGYAAEASPDGEPGEERGRGVELVAWRRAGRVSGEVSYSRGWAEFEGPEGDRWASPAERRYSLDVTLQGRLMDGVRLVAVFRNESGWPYVLGPWVCPEDEECEHAMGDPLRPTDFTYRRAPDYQTLDILADWEGQAGPVGIGLALSLRNALGRNNAAAYRPDGCSGAELISALCENPVGVGRFAPGLSGPTPGVALRVRF